MCAAGNTIISGSAYKTIRVWDINTGEFLRILHGGQHTDAVRSLYTTGEIRLSSSSGDTTFRILGRYTMIINTLVKYYNGHYLRDIFFHFLSTNTNLSTFVRIRLNT
jgi:WD40 repeat protein